MIMHKIKALIKKIDIYYEDKITSGEVLPHGKTGMKLSAIFSYCFYGTSFSEYFAYRFYALNRKEKRTYMTRRYMFRFFDKYNPEQYRNRIGDKRETNKYYGQFMKRDQFNYTEGIDNFIKFAEKHPTIFVKQAISWGGEGAYKADVSTITKARAEYERLNSNCVIEEYIENCHEIKKLFPGSLNTIKILTLQLKDKPEIETALFRMGNNTPVDNVHLGGICALVDIETGIVTTKAYDNHFKEYVRHPITGEQIVGFNIPQWEEVKKLALSAANVTPEMRYSSWDIALTNAGPILIEGNWDAEFYPEQMIMREGIRYKYCAKLQKT